MKKLSVVLLSTAVVVILMNLFALNVHALPAFARKYKTSCITCHVAYPKLTSFGEAFRRNGFQFPEGTDPEYIKEEPVSLGAEAYKRVFPKAIWPGQIPGTAPLAVRFEGQYQITPNAEITNDFRVPGSMTVMTGGTLGENISFYSDIHLFDHGEVGFLNRAYLQFSNLLDRWIPASALNLKVGQFTTAAVPFSMHRDAFTLTPIVLSVYSPQMKDSLEAGHHGEAGSLELTQIMDNTGNVYQVVELTQEVTQRKMVEAEMVHSAKMAVLGSMAAGIAHEIGNPLASISTRLRLLEKKHDETFLKESLRLLQSQIARINRIVHGISQFAKSVKEEWSACQINQIVVETLNVLRFHPKAKKNQIYTELAEELPETMGVKDQLVQVFLNLGLNALEAMPHGGVLTVKTYTGEGEIRIEFADTGAGMDRELRSKIFDPFFTTKDNGLGLGLCIVHNIIDAHGGRIEVVSTPAEGSLFTVSLPIRTSGELSHNIMEVPEQ